jgi:molybdopterin-guanine dinucleotide biosynthesis protein
MVGAALGAAAGAVVAVDATYTTPPARPGRADQLGFISPQGSAVFWKKPLSLENITPYLEADFLLIEGFKRSGLFQRSSA